MTLLEKAQTVRSRSRVSRPVDAEEIDLALAWARGEITFTQAAKAYGVTNGNVYNRLALALREHLQTLARTIKSVEYEDEAVQLAGGDDRGCAVSDFVFQMHDADGHRWFVIPNTREAKRVLRTMTGVVESAVWDGDTLMLDRDDAVVLRDALDLAYNVSVCHGQEARLR